MKLNISAAIFCVIGLLCLWPGYTVVSFEHDLGQLFANIWFFLPLSASALLFFITSGGLLYQKKWAGILGIIMGSIAMLVGAMIVIQTITDQMQMHQQQMQYANWMQIPISLPIFLLPLIAVVLVLLSWKHLRK